MNANELRIGNKIQDRNGFIFNVVGIGEDWITTDFESNEGYAWEFYSKTNPPIPIKLTEEILLKCEGVIKHPTIENIYFLEDSNYSFRIEDGDWDNPSLDILINGMYIICVEFLHEFQNLYFALNCKELEIELWKN